MKHKTLLILLTFLSVLCSGAVSAQRSKLNPIAEPDAQEFAQTFQKGPGRDFSTGPLWTWNDRLTEEQIRGTLQDLASQNVKQVWVHPRPGLMTPYLSEEWFQRWKEALDEAKKLDMNVWIYDENSYPSGFAGGFVPDAMPDSRGMGLRFEEVSSLERFDDGAWYAFRIEGENKYVNVTQQAKAANKLEPLPDGKKYLIGRVRYTPSGAWFGGKWYVDLLKKGVTEKFIEITFDAYKNVPEIREEFGKRVPGIFTDEPHPAGTYVGTWVSWNEEIPELFEKRFGYSLVDSLPSLYKPVGDWKKVRHNYHKLILELFIDRWAKPCYEWCEANNLEFTGHYWEHGWPGTSHGPDNMAMYIWHQRPAIDILMNQYSEHVNGQFGNVRSVKELSSVANQLGHSRTLCELYGAGGWDLRFEDMKRQADWIQALGVNTINEHLSYVTIRGARKRDHPQSFSYHAPWWEGYHVLANRNTRLQYALSQGRQVNKVLIIEPTTTAWMYQGEAKLGEIGNSFQNFVNELEKANVEYDLGSEDIMERLGSVTRHGLRVGQSLYDVVILPPNMENIGTKTFNQISGAARRSVAVCYFDVPKYLDGKTLNKRQSEQMQRFLETPSVAKVDLQQAIRRCKARTSADGFRLISDKPESGKVYHHRRRLGNQDVVFLTNISITEPAKGWVYSKKDNVENWCLDTGEQSRYPYEIASDSTIRFRYELPPCGSILLVLSEGNRTGFIEPKKWEIVHKSKSETQIKRLEPNVLTLDYVDVATKGETLKDIYFFRANNWLFEKNGQGIGITRNPWDSGVQFKDELITKEFPQDSHFMAAYKFTIADKVPGDLKIVIERPDLYEIHCNGEPVSAALDLCWLDKSFGVIDISKAAKVGSNEVSLLAKPMNIYHELESAYLLGDFSLKSSLRGFTVAPPQPLKLRTPEPEEKITTHSTEIERVAWLSKGVGFHGEDVKKGDTAPYLVFDLGEPCIVDEIKIWNYNERNLTKRGVKELKIYSSATPSPKDVLEYSKFLLEEGSSKGPQMISLELPEKRPENRYLIFEILSNHNGINYPIPETELKQVKNRDNAFVGLAEVRFYTKNLVPINGVKIAAKSSELVQRSHDRKADYLLDGSGLEPYTPQQGWNRQGMPFYCGGVSYKEIFELEEKEPNRKFYVKLPDSPNGWYGSTAKVIANGKLAGYVMSAPWSVDVTKFVQKGVNEIEVVVIGTPKNLLGPHHISKVRGTAWPGMFHNAPTNLPHGDSYDTIGYGLFEPVRLIESNQ